MNEPTIYDHARATGHAHRMAGGLEGDPDLRLSPEHRTAAAVHGWLEHELHTGKAMRLSAEDYTRALEHAGSTRRHPPAVSPHAPKASADEPKASADELGGAQ